MIHAGCKQDAYGIHKGCILYPYMVHPGRIQDTHWMNSGYKKGTLTHDILPRELTCRTHTRSQVKLLGCFAGIIFNTCLRHVVKKC